MQEVKMLFRRVRLHISSPKWCDSSHSKYQPQHEVQSAAPSPQPDHSLRSPWNQAALNKTPTKRTQPTKFALHTVRHSHGVEQVGTALAPLERLKKKRKSFSILCLINKVIFLYYDNRIFILLYISSPWRWAHHDWLGEHDSEHSCTGDDRSRGTPEKFWL